MERLRRKGSTSSAKSLSGLAYLDIVQPKKCLTDVPIGWSDFGPKTNSYLDLRTTGTKLENKLVDRKTNYEAKLIRDKNSIYIVGNKKIETEKVKDSEYLHVEKAKMFDRQCPLVNEKTIQNQFIREIQSGRVDDVTSRIQILNKTAGLERDLTYGSKNSNCQAQPQVHVDLNYKVNICQAQKQLDTLNEINCNIQNKSSLKENKQLNNCQAQIQPGMKHITQSEKSVNSQFIKIQSHTSELDTVLGKIKNKNKDKIYHKISPKKIKTPSKSRKNKICSDDILKPSPKSHSVKKKNKSIVQSIIRDFESRTIPPTSSPHGLKKDIKSRRIRVKKELEVSTNQSKITTFFSKEKNREETLPK